MIQSTFDFCKAFNSVSHSKLLFKLRQYGIQGNLLSWITDFLLDRSQQVKIMSTLSYTLPVTSGMPQGSVLGPILFLLYINDLALLEDDKAKMLIFADDVKIYAKSANHIALQNLIDRISAWSCKWQLPISFTKTQILHFGHTNPKFTYNIDNINISYNPNSTVRDLGILLSENLNFSPYICQIVKKAFHRIFLLLRYFKSHDIKLLSLAYKIYVRPMLEYSTTVWSPHTKSNINMIEKVQRYFTRKILDNSSLPYHERLKILHLETLETRRQKNDLTMVYKIFHNEVDIVASHFFTLSTSNTRRLHKFKLTPDTFRLKLKKYFFTQRVIPLWNNLPCSIVDLPSSNSFKFQISKHWDSILSLS